MLRSYPGTRYWFIDGHDSEIWSGRDGAFVPLTDAGYADFLTDGETATYPTSVSALVAHLKQYNLPYYGLLTLTELQQERTAEIIAACDARLESRWPLTDRLAALSGCPTTPGIADDVLAHALERDRCLALIAAATDVQTVMEVTPSWPV